MFHQAWKTALKAAAVSTVPVMTANP